MLFSRPCCWTTECLGAIYDERLEERMVDDGEGEVMEEDVDAVLPVERVFFFEGDEGDPGVLFALLWRAR